MIQIFSFALSLCLVPASFAAEQVAHMRRPPDAGISDDDLVNLGTAADTEMIERFAKTGNEALRDGLLFRMRLYGDLTKPNVKIFSHLRNFVEQEVANCSGEVPLQRIFNIDAALQVAGQRGGKFAVEYLKQWVGEESVYGRVKCFNHLRDAVDTQDQLRRSALMGLGYTGEKSARDFLGRAAQKPPRGKYVGSLKDIIDVAIAEFDDIHKNGIENHFKESRENIKAYRNDKKKSEDLNRK